MLPADQSWRQGRTLRLLDASAIAGQPLPAQPPAARENLRTERRPSAEQHTGTPTPTTGNAADKSPPASKLPQRPRTTSLPGVRIEGGASGLPTSELGTTLRPHALHPGGQPARHRTRRITPEAVLTRENTYRHVLGVKGSPVQIRPSRLVVEFFRIYLCRTKASERAISL